ncbi:MAG: cation diffusion facilitator family transporter, partial [Propionivibrio sp.]
PGPVDGEVVMLVAVIGLVINIGVAWLLMRGEQTMNTRGALLHVIGDLFGSLAAFVAGVVITLTGWTPIDPWLSLLICVLILVSSLRLLREILRALLEGAPADLSVNQIGQCLATVPGVRSVHDLHVWTLSSNRPLLSAHLIVDSFERWPTILATAQQVLAERGIEHVTLQPEAAQRHPIQWFPNVPEDEPEQTSKAMPKREEAP